MDNKTFLQLPVWENGDNRMKNSCCSRNSSHFSYNDGSSDKYTAAIELSNRCREFYKSRLEAANNIKSRWLGTPTRSTDLDADSGVSCSSSSSSSLCSDINENEKTSTSRQPRQRIDAAMEKLRSEMVSLMDQDLSLMKQLLTLNETIEELKWQQQHYCSNSSASWVSFSTSKNLGSNYSVSDTEMYDSEDELHHTPSCSVQTDRVSASTWNSTRNSMKTEEDFSKTALESSKLIVKNLSSPLNSLTTSVTSTRSDFSESGSTTSGTSSQKFMSDHHVITSGPIIVHHEREQNSFDSGIHESTSGDELTWSS